MQVTIFLSTKTRDSGCYRAKGDIFNADAARTLFDNEGYKFVAILAINDQSVSAALTQAYRDTQNVDAPWRKVAPCRSTMVGDIFEVNGERYIVAGLGFDSLGTWVRDQPLTQA